MEILGKTVLGFSGIAGDETAYKNVWQYIYGEFGFSELLEQYMFHGKYGDELILILVMLYIEGKADWFTMPAKPKLGRFSNKEKSYEYSVPVTKDSFFCLPPLERKLFLVEQMQNAVNAAENQFRKKKMNTDFGLIKTDLATVCDLYLSKATPDS